MCRKPLSVDILFTCPEFKRCHASSLSSKRTFVDSAGILNCVMVAILLFGSAHRSTANGEDFQGGAHAVLTIVAKKNAVMPRYNTRGITSHMNVTSMVGSSRKKSQSTRSTYRRWDMCLRMIQAVPLTVDSGLSSLRRISILTLAATFCTRRSNLWNASLLHSSMLLRLEQISPCGIEDHADGLSPRSRHANKQVF